MTQGSAHKCSYEGKEEQEMLLAHFDILKKWQYGLIHKQRESNRSIQNNQIKIGGNDHTWDHMPTSLKR